MNTSSRSVALAQPTPDQLRAYLLGKLAEPELQQVSAWVESCPDPDAVLAPYLENDTLCDALGQGSTKIDTQEAGEGLKQFLGIATIETATLGPKDSPVRPYDLNTPEYQFVRELGRGGMGIVCEAEELKLHRRVALKMMLPELATRPDAKLRFLREARMMASATSDHIVPVWHIGENQTGVPFLVMPLLEGETLEDRLRKSSLSINEILTIAEQTTLGLIDAHAKGLIHRDIKPSNLWLESNADGSLRRVRVLDFGLARPIESEGVVTGTHTVMGTPAYMSPEQARGESLDARTDLFSVGVMLYRLCTGKLPFSGPNVLAILTSLAVHEPRPVREINPNIPVELSDLVQRLMAKSADARLNNSKELLASIQGIKAKLTTPTETITQPQPSTNKGKSSRFKLAVGGMFAAMALLIVGGIIIIIKDKMGKETKVEVPDGSTITIVPDDKTEPKKKDPVEPSKPSVPTDADRIAAEKILALGGVVTVKIAEEQWEVKDERDLPKKAFVLTGVELSNPAKFKDDDFACFKGLTSLISLQLNGVPMKAKEFAYFKDCKNLKSLSLLQIDTVDEGLVHLGCKELVEFKTRSTNLTDKGLENLKNSTKLQQLSLWVCSITDEGFENFKNCRDLREFSVVGCQKVRNAGFAYLKDCTELRSFSMSHVKATGAALQYLKNCKKMAELGLNESEVDNDSLKYLSEMTLLERLYLVRSRVTSEGLVHLNPLVNLTSITIEGNQFQGGLAELNNLKKLKSINIGGATDELLSTLGKHPSLQDILAHGSMTTDIGLGSLKGVKTLRTITLTQTKVTPEGVADFQKAITECKVQLDGKHYPALKQPLEVSPTDADRIAAEKILALGGTVTVRVDTDELPISKLEDLPEKSKFILTGVVLETATKFKEGDFACFKGLTGLISLKLAGIPMKAKDFEYFKDTKNLQSITLIQVESVDEGLPQLELKEVSEFIVFPSNLTDKGLEKFKNCTKLRKVIIWGANITDEGLESFQNCRDLEYLALDDCRKVRSAGFAYLKDCTELKTVNLRATQATGVALKHLKNCRKMNSLDLTGCPIQDDDLAHLKDMTALEHLQLRGTNISDVGIVHLKDLANIQGLSIRGTKITGKGLQVISEFKKLEWLDAVGLNATDEEVKMLLKLSALKSLLFEQASITDKAFETFKEMKSLETLNVSRTKVTQKGVDEFKKAKPRCGVFYEP